MRYVLMISEGRDEPALEGCAAWAEEMEARGVLREILRLQRSETARTVQVRQDEVLPYDGPFAETREQVGGLAVIECADLDEAVDVAAAHPWAKVGAIEVRPIWDREPLDL